MLARGIVLAFSCSAFMACAAQIDDTQEIIDNLGSPPVTNIPIPRIHPSSDFDIDFRTDFAVWRPGTGVWFVIRSSDGAVVTQPWGVNGDIPTTGDYDGDGRADFAVWRPSTGVWFVIRSSNGAVVTQPWGVAGDVPTSRPTGS